jgi:hypothetical protein
VFTAVIPSRICHPTCLFIVGGPICAYIAVAVSPGDCLTAAFRVFRATPRRLCPRIRHRPHHAASRPGQVRGPLFSPASFAIGSGWACNWPWSGVASLAGFPTRSPFTCRPKRQQRPVRRVVLRDLSSYARTLKLPGALAGKSPRVFELRACASRVRLGQHRKQVHHQHAAHLQGSQVSTPMRCLVIFAPLAHWSCFGRCVTLALNQPNGSEFLTRGIPRSSPYSTRAGHRLLPQPQTVSVAAPLFCPPRSAASVCLPQPLVLFAGVCLAPLQGEGDRDELLIPGAKKLPPELRERMPPEPPAPEAAPARQDERPQVIRQLEAVAFGDREEEDDGEGAPSPGHKRELRGALRLQPRGGRRPPPPLVKASTGFDCGD